LEYLAIEYVSIFYGHLVYYTVFWYILLPFCIFYDNLGSFSHVLVCCKMKNLATLQMFAALNDNHVV
jgi:hypothetical protein